MFDFDGLIVDTEWPEYRAIAEQFEAVGLPYPPQRWVHVIGTSWDIDWVSELAAAIPGGTVDREAATARRRARSAELRRGMAPLAGVVDRPVSPEPS